MLSRDWSVWLVFLFGVIILVSGVLFLLRRKEDHERYKNIFEAIAFLFAAAFFTYQIAMGFSMYDSMNVAISDTRCKIDDRNDKEYLRIVVTLEANDQISCQLRNVYIAAFEDESAKPPVLQWEISPPRLVVSDVQNRNWKGINPKEPFIHVRPREKTQFAVFGEVDRKKPYIIQVLVDGHRPGNFLGSAQWRASAVSLPNAQQ